MPSENTASDCLLAIETTCDETAAAIIDRGLGIRSSVVASQDQLHARFGGVVPEIASREHVRCVLPVIAEALTSANVRLSDLKAIAVAVRPGLVGSLLVGLTAAKTLSAVLGIPLIAVDHIAAHIYACRMAAGRDVFPAVGFVVSGGHTNFYDCPNAVEMELVGSTIDDAAGEAFDKVAQILGLPYPGGPSIQAVAVSGNASAYKFPRPLIHEENLDFSFSGLKTAVLYTVEGTPGGREPRQRKPLTPTGIADVAASFQEAAVDVLIAKCRRALQTLNRKTLCIGGGVAANRRFRDRLLQLADETGIDLLIAPPNMCTDNAAMAGIAWEMLDRGMTADLEIDVTPGLVRRPRRKIS